MGSPPTLPRLHSIYRYSVEWKQLDGLDARIQNAVHSAGKVAVMD